MPRTLLRYKKTGAVYAYNTTTREWWQYTQKKVAFSDVPKEIVADTLDAVARGDFIKEIEVGSDEKVEKKPRAAQKKAAK